MADESILFSAPLCLSGGAKGADAQFGMCAGMAGHTVIHWSFKGARVHVPEEEVVRLTEEQLAEANPFLERANQTLKRKLDYKAYWIKLLQRNYFQVKDSTSLFAVSTIKDNLVQGGTSWAIQLFLDANNNASCPCYVYDQVKEKWFIWHGCWDEIQDVPTPTGVYAGIGTRDLNTSGKNAIRSLLGYVKLPS